MTTTVINTVQNVTYGTTYVGGNLLVTSAGAYIDSNGDGLSFVSETSSPLGTVTIDGFVYGDGTAMSFLGTGSNGKFFVDGTVQGGSTGFSFSDQSGFTGSASLVIGTQGTIEGGGVAISVNASDIHIANAGFIAGSGSGIVGIVVAAGTDGFELTNTGQILSGVSLASVADSVTNSGSIAGGLVLGQADIAGNTGSITGGLRCSGSAVVTNAGTITGGVIDAASVTSDSLDNSGKIVGGVEFDGAGVSLTNSGLIHGPVALGSGSALVNTGAIHGDVTLGAKDTFEIDNGVVSGVVHASASDVFVFDGPIGQLTITGFEPGGRTHDALDFADGVFANYAALQSHMAQVGKNVVITIDASDSIVLQNMTLAHLHPVDFHFI